MALIEPQTTPTDLSQDRARLTELIVSSPATRKLIVAGPGTGKTYTFCRALEASGGRGLALTFINNLAHDLERELADVADSNTFHGFCKSLLHRTHLDDLTPHFDYYPPLPMILADDLCISGYGEITHEELVKCYQCLNHDAPAISEALRIGVYYDAVSHEDAVYRVLQHLKANRDSVPNFPLVVVDEYQDFNRLETEFIDLLAEKSPVLIAGDDDQALYGFKHASPTYIRDLAQADHYEKFELPYCSRCTEVVVNSVHDILNKAERVGLLTERLAKRYLYFPPEKSEDSSLYPRIIHAHCTVENNRSPYMGRYVAERIGEIPLEEIRASRENHYPTALVIGPVEFVKRAYETLKDRFTDVVLKKSTRFQIDILDGYRRLHRNQNSRLGWRIILYCDRSVPTGKIIELALTSGEELSDLIPSEYRDRHLEVAKLVRRLENGETLIDEEREALGEAVGESFNSIGRSLTVGDEKSEGSITASSFSCTEPSIVCTSLLGAKGLSASRVFIVGFNNGHFPRDPTAITDDEVRSLLVGLSRTRKQCYLVSCGWFGQSKLQPSVFLKWIPDRVTQEWVNKKWMTQRGKPAV